MYRVSICEKSKKKSGKYSNFGFTRIWIRLTQSIETTIFWQILGNFILFYKEKRDNKPEIRKKDWKNLVLEKGEKKSRYRKNKQ